LGVNTNECNNFVNKLLGEEKEKNDGFVLQNPEILLPVNLYIDGIEGVNNPDESISVSQSRVLNT
jgi:hypothetical protein